MFYRKEFCAGRSAELDCLQQRACVYFAQFATHGRAIGELVLLVKRHPHASPFIQHRKLLVGVLPSRCVAPLADNDVRSANRFNIVAAQSIGKFPIE